MTTHDTLPVPLSAGGRVPERLPEARVLLLCPGPADRSRAGAPADPHQRGGCPAELGVQQPRERSLRAQRDEGCRE